MIEMNPLYIMYACILSWLDISLTYYIMWYDKKLNPTQPRFQELNILQRIFMEKTKGGPWGLLIGAIFSQALIILVGRLAPIEIGYYAVTFMTGAIFIAVWIHTFSIKQLDKQNKKRTAVRELIGEPLGTRD